MENLSVEEYLALIEPAYKSADDVLLSQNVMGRTPIAQPSQTGKLVTRLVISTNDVDRGRDILDPMGVDLTHFKLNPLFLWEHGKKYTRDQSILGKALAIYQYPDRIEADVMYVPTTGNDLPLRIHDMDTKGLLPGNSIGWRPLGDITIDRATGIRRVGRWELLEISKVVLPMNGRAVNLQQGT